MSYPQAFGGGNKRMGRLLSNEPLLRSCVNGDSLPLARWEKKLGHQPGLRPIADKLAAKVTTAVAEGRSCGWIARDLVTSKNIVLEIMKRYRQCAL